MEMSKFYDMVARMTAPLEELSYEEMNALLTNYEKFSQEYEIAARELFEGKREIEQKKQKAIDLMDEALSIMHELEQDGHITLEFYDYDGVTIEDPIFTTNDSWKIEDFNAIMEE